MLALTTGHPRPIIPKCCVIEDDVKYKCTTLKPEVVI